MCKFCENIMTENKYKSLFEYPWDEKTALVKTEYGIGIYIPCEDDYYSRVGLYVKY